MLSDTGCLNSGVPQGSILEPLLFVCYVNDLPKYTGALETYLYADDTALLSKGNNIVDINATLQNNFNNMLNWFAINRLSLNANKTKVMMFCSQRSALRNQELCIASGDIKLE